MLPLHFALESSWVAGDKRTAVVTKLLEHYPEAAATRLNAVRAWSQVAGAFEESVLPLHFALCESIKKTATAGKAISKKVDTKYEADVFRALIDANPEAVREPLPASIHLGMMPLHLALQNDMKCMEIGTLENGVHGDGVCRMLLAEFAGACAIADTDGNLPLHVALDACNKPAAVIHEVWSHHADAVRTANRNGRLPFHIVFEHEAPPTGVNARPAVCHPATRDGRTHALARGASC
jgi:hypothetical protein